MNYETLSVSKFKNSAKPGDDVALIIPGVIAAVFDGATDPLGQDINGMTSGRFAAECVSHACAKLFLDPGNFTLPSDEIVGHLSMALANATKGWGFRNTPSTTAAMAIFGPRSVRLITIGDTGIRVNTGLICRHEKLIDDVSTTARVAVFLLLQRRLVNKDELEMATRSVVYRGLIQAVSDGILKKHEAQSIVATTLKAFTDHQIDAKIVSFLDLGIQSQKSFANHPTHPLGFSSLDGQLIRMNDVIDKSFEIDLIKTLEIFSDGYAKIPAHHRVQDWESGHRLVEQEDFHKVDEFPSVKGSTKTEFNDDRTVVSIELE